MTDDPLRLRLISGERTRRGVCTKSLLLSAFFCIWLAPGYAQVRAAEDGNPLPNTPRPHITRPLFPAARLFQKTAESRSSRVGPSIRNYSLGPISPSGGLSPRGFGNGNAAGLSGGRRFEPLALRPHIACPGGATCWTGSTTGNWSVAGNWSNGVPTSSLNVFIDNGNPQASAVTLDVAGAAANLTIDNDDSLSFNNNISLTISGSTISNAGNIKLNSAGNVTDLIINGPSSGSTVTLSGGGTLTMGNNTNNRIYSNQSAILANQETIQGAGQIGVGMMSLNNSGTIDANVSNTLTINPNSSGVTNTGTLEATSGGTLILDGTYTNTGGTIKADGTTASSTVQLSGATINGGTLSTITTGGSNIGLIEASGTPTLNGVTLSSGSVYTLPNNTATLFTGTITNNGTIQVNSAGNVTDIQTAASGGTTTFT